MVAILLGCIGAPLAHAAAPTPSPTIDLNADFESGMDGWVTPESSSTNAFNRDYGSTPSSGTGPSDGASGDYYVYAEASSPNVGAVFTMYKYTGGLVAAVNFSYHMYGADMGTVLLQGSASVDDDGSSYTTLWSKSGNSGNSWLSATVRVSSSGYDWLRFHYTSGTSITETSHWTTFE